MIGRFAGISVALYHCISAEKYFPLTPCTKISLEDEYLLGIESKNYAEHLCSSPTSLDKLIDFIQLLFVKSYVKNFVDRAYYLDIPMLIGIELNREEILSNENIYN
jgi:hypothetical protein